MKTSGRPPVKDDHTHGVVGFELGHGRTELPHHGRGQETFGRIGEGDGGDATVDAAVDVTHGLPVALDGSIYGGW
jgi:hypothetical protein